MGNSSQNLEFSERLSREIPFFEGFEIDALQIAIPHISIRSHPANQVILLEHDWGGSVYFIMDGWVKIRTHNVDGREVTLNIVGRGEVVGEMAAIEEAPRSTDVITLTSAEVCSIPATEFYNFLKTEPMAGIRLAQIIARRLRQLNRRLRLREAESLTRVVDTLLFLAEGRGRDTDEGVIIPNLPHRELSSISGLARETVTRCLTKLEKRGLIHRDLDFISVANLKDLEDLIS
ncbi:MULTISPECIES: Crp/Fnr family transcriptional regulator [unclassified Synechocystis]|uniref:Crp/Fnr family transcriptional regulator n=1 Tax=unclassified Synechocystis TaxID=2640012 RepID=UPI0003FE5F81|nr:MULTISPECIES: Crp/Fnr family transcriptional regulator [unclassified Synechocystis]AIE75859.1 transcriptional regulator, Crp/Fnr family [Synechocystis sp. PCC 6714]MCT0255212.1 Crp/Fnr family transcriptional regulator [Synechocystis sp. CS-94]